MGAPCALSISIFFESLPLTSITSSFSRQFLFTRPAYHGRRRRGYNQIACHRRRANRNRPVRRNTGLPPIEPSQLVRASNSTTTSQPILTRNSVSPTHPIAASPAAAKRTLNQTQPSSKPMSSPPRARPCTMRSRIRASTRQKTRSWPSTRQMGQFHRLRTQCASHWKPWMNIERRQTRNRRQTLPGSQRRASVSLLKRVFVFPARREPTSSRWDRQIGGIAFGCCPRRRCTCLSAGPWISGGRRS